MPEPQDPTRPYLISMVCLGNICRSPMAAVVLAQRLADSGLVATGRNWPGVDVDSAGTGSWHIGHRMDDRAESTLREAGYDQADIDRHRARQVQRSWFAHRDLILGMDDANLRTLRDTAPRTMRDQGRVRLFGTYGDVGPVPDPWTGGQDGFVHVLQLVEKATDALVAELAGLRSRHVDRA